MKKSLYTVSTTRLDRLKNRGFDYEGKIFQKSMSPYLFGDPKRRSILAEYEKIFYFLVEKAKYVKIFYNYTVPKDYKPIN
jgi:hypothetical protein